MSNIEIKIEHIGRKGNAELGASDLSARVSHRHELLRLILNVLVLPLLVVK